MKKQRERKREAERNFKLFQEMTTTSQFIDDMRILESCVGNIKVPRNIPAEQIPEDLKVPPPSFAGRWWVKNLSSWDSSVPFPEAQQNASFSATLIGWGTGNNLLNIVTKNQKISPPIQKRKVVKKAKASDFSLFPGQTGNQQVIIDAFNRVNLALGKIKTKELGKFALYWFNPFAILYPNPIYNGSLPSPPPGKLNPPDVETLLIKNGYGLQPGWSLSPPFKYLDGCQGSYCTSNRLKDFIVYVNAPKLKNNTKRPGISWATMERDRIQKLKQKEKNLS